MKQRFNYISITPKLSRFGKLLFLLVITIITSNYAAAADIDLTKPVWVFSPTATDPTNPTDTFATLWEAMNYVNNTLKKHNAVIEFHDDTYETKTTAAPSYSVTIRSEADVNHTVSYQDFSSTNTVYALSSNNAVVTTTLGGGEGYGILTFDLCGNLGGLTISTGKVYIQEGAILKNGKAITGGAVRMLNSSGAVPVLYISGGSFINNQANKKDSTVGRGGAICVSAGILYLSGGTFIGNTATDEGNAIFYGNTREIHISGNPVFNDGQDIFIIANSTDDASITALIKDGPITSSNIPVTIGGEEKTIWGYRNVLKTGTENVIESDLARFSLFNGSYLADFYLGLGYNANDATTKKPVLELVTDFIDNYDNFIDDNYKPAASGFSHAKSAKWLDDDKNQAEITIDESSSDGKTVLIIGSLCGAHGLTSDCIKTVINEAAKHNDVEFYFESQTAGALSQFTQKEEGKPIAGKMRGPTKGTVAKGKSLPTTYTFTTYSGAHQATGTMAKELKKRLQEKQYLEIIFVFDNATIFNQCYQALTPEEQIACYQVANMLVPYYESEKVIWVSSGKNVMYLDYETHRGYTYESTDPTPVTSLLMKGCYSSDISLYHYDKNHVTNNENSYGKYDKFNAFFTMALMDPATWLKGVEEKRIPEWEEYSINTEGVLYFNVDAIINYINNKFFRDEIVIKDVVASGLTINEAYLESSSDNGTTWTKVTSDNVSIKIEGQKVTCDIDNIMEGTDIRLKIICDCPGEFVAGHDKPKDTNVGNATIEYIKDGESRMTYELESPQLLKVFPRADIIIKKSGLKPGESAVFTVTSSGADEVLFTVAITGDTNGSGQVTLKYVLLGEYTVEETGWSWAYTPDPTDGKITQDISVNNTFTFVNTPKEDIPLHGEASKNNVFKTSGNN